MQIVFIGTYFAATGFFELLDENPLKPVASGVEKKPDFQEIDCSSGFVHPPLAVSIQPSTGQDDSSEITTEIKLSKNQAFALGGDDFRRIADTAKEVLSQPLKLEAKCSDGVTRQFNSLEKFLSYNNASTSRLEEVSLRVSQYSPTLREFKLSLGSSSPNISGSISADENTREDAVRSVLEVLRGAKPWHGWIAGWNIHPSYFLLLAACFFAFTVFVISADWGPANPGERLAFRINFAKIGFCISLLLPVFGWPLDKLRRYLFPRSVFLIGAGISRDEKLNIWRQIIVGSIIVGGAISLLCGLLIEFWFHR
jgi:hypothetical protein